MRILTVNQGSTSLKLAVVEDGRAVARPDDLAAALAEPGLEAIAHRVVHGGDRSGATLVDTAVRSELEALIDRAPLHQPPALAALDEAAEARPDLAQVACFDTAFHRTIPAAARTYALPARLRATVEVHGFHGLSHAWAAGRVAREVPSARRVVVAHLGGGQSLCAVLDGVSVATTMGFTPLDGLVMATRSGSIDPGAVLWLQAHTDEDLGRVLERESGLLGLAGTPDMAEVLDRRAAGDEAAALAVDVWRHRLVAAVGAAAATLGGLDVLAFTGGIGERSAEARALVTDRLAWLGAEVLVVESREDLQMAAETEALLLA